MSESYKENKIGAVRFGVLSLPELDYNPPSSCLGTGGRTAADAAKYRAEWDDAVLKTLSANFKKQSFVSIPMARLEELGINSASFYSLAQADIEKMGVQEYEIQGGEEKPIDYLPSRTAGKMREFGNKLKAGDSVDYFIAMVEPRMTGETSYTPGGMVPMAGGGMMMTGGSASTSYTSDVRFGIWSAETGEVAYASGSIAASSGFCFFVSPQSASINGASGDMSTQLKALLTAFLRRAAPAAVEVGRAEGPARALR